MSAQADRLLTTPSNLLPLFGTLAVVSQVINLPFLVFRNMVVRVGCVS